MAIESKEYSSCEIESCDFRFLQLCVIDVKAFIFKGSKFNSSVEWLYEIFSENLKWYLVIRSAINEKKRVPWVSQKQSILVTHSTSIQCCHLLTQLFDLILFSLLPFFQLLCTARHSIDQAEFHQIPFSDMYCELKVISLVFTSFWILSRDCLLERIVPLCEAVK